MARNDASDRQDIFDVLAREHRTVESLFEQLEALAEEEPEECRELFMVLQQKLLAHTDAEESLVYPRFAELSDELEERIAESREEHAVVEKLMAEIEELGPDDESFLPKLKVLEDLVAHHVREEEGEIFELAREELDDAEAEALAVDFEGEIAAHLGETPDEEKVEPTDLGPPPRPFEAHAPA